MKVTSSTVKVERSNQLPSHYTSVLLQFSSREEDVQFSIESIYPLNDVEVYFTIHKMFPSYFQINKTEDLEAYPEGIICEYMRGLYAVSIYRTKL
jgi:hypothetical protein